MWGSCFKSDVVGTKCYFRGKFSTDTGVEWRFIVYGIKGITGSFWTLESIYLRGRGGDGREMSCCLFHHFSFLPKLGTNTLDDMKINLYFFF